jgi:hypothetical protein
MAARLLAASESAGASLDSKILLVSACVGEGPAMEWGSWYTNLDLPDPEELLAKPDKFTLPAEQDKRLVILHSVVKATLGNSTAKRYQACWSILASSVKQASNAVDIAALAAKELAEHGVEHYPNVSVPDVRVFNPILKAAGFKS